MTTPTYDKAEADVYIARLRAMVQRLEAENAALRGQQEWVDAPTSEGWWVFQGVTDDHEFRNPVCVHVTEDHVDEYIVEVSTLKGWIPVVEFSGKWQRIMPPKVGG